MDTWERSRALVSRCPRSSRLNMKYETEHQEKYRSHVLGKYSELIPKTMKLRSVKGRRVQ